MKLDVRLFAGLKCNNQELPCLGKNEFELEVPGNTTVEALQSLLKLDSRYPLVYIINGMAQKDDWVLAEGDRIGIFPPVGGG